jgi:DNA-binding MarR family transcriptional regulator
VKSSARVSTKPATRRARRVDAVQEATELRVALVRIHRQLRSRSINEVTPSQASALARIEQIGPSRLGVLAEAEGTTAATMCRVVDSLEQRGLIARVADPLDGRASHVQLSDEGGALLSDLRARSTEVLRRALAELSVVERKSIAQAIPVLERLSGLLSQVDR